MLIVKEITKIYGEQAAYKKKYAEEQRLQERLIAQQEKGIKDLSDFVQWAKQASRTNHAIKRMGQEWALRLEKKKQTAKPGSGL